MLDLSLIALLTVHLLAMNVATAAPLVCMWLKRRQRRYDDAAAGRVGQFLAWQSITSLLLGIVVGTALLGLLWLRDDAGFYAAVSVVPRRRLWFGLVELLFFLACMGVYAAGWQRLTRRPKLHHALAILAATDLIYHFPPLFAAVAVLQARPELWGQQASYREFMAILGQPETLARVAHFLLASLAVTGTMMLAYAWRLASRQADEAQRVAAWGARLALVPTMLQLLAGVGLLLALPETSQRKLMGGDVLASALFIAGAGAMFPLLHYLAALSWGEADRAKMARSLVWMGLVVLLMVGTRQYARHTSPPVRHTAQGVYHELGNR